MTASQHVNSPATRGALARLIDAAKSLGPTWTAAEAAEATGINLTTARSLLREIAARGDPRIEIAHRGTGRNGDVVRYRLSSNVDAAAKASLRQSVLAVLAAEYRAGTRQIHWERLRVLMAREAPDLSGDRVRDEMKRLGRACYFIHQMVHARVTDQWGRSRQVSQWALRPTLVGCAPANSGRSVSPVQAWRALVTAWDGLADVRTVHPVPKRAPPEDDDTLPAHVHDKLAKWARDAVRAIR
jgi:hypothetical protein